MKHYQIHKKFCTSKNPQKTLLVRDFIHDRLYYPNEGYFTKEKLQLGKLSSPLIFSEMIGFEDYQRLLSEKYPKYAWLTPSEIFKPYYGLTLANYINEAFSYYLNENLQKSNKIKIIEVGAGHGSAADSILQFFKLYNKKVYLNIDYTIVEISYPLLQKAKELLSLNHKELFGRRQLKFVNDSIVNYNLYDGDKVFVIMLEVLDNMPHDRVYKNSKGKWELQTKVDMDKKIEIKEPIQDELIKKTMNLYEKYKKYRKEESEKEDLVRKIYSFFRSNSEDNIFLPTTCIDMITKLNQVLPNHHFIIGDFDMLKESKSARTGINAPIVSKKLEKSHEKEDFDSYLVDRGQADIFFPTDFSFLKFCYKELTTKGAKIFQTYQFVEEFSKDKWAETKSGYNPLKSDFSNTSIFLTKESFLKQPKNQSLPILFSTLQDIFNQFPIILG